MINASYSFFYIIFKILSGSVIIPIAFWENKDLELLAHNCLTVELAEDQFTLTPEPKFSALHSGLPRICGTTLEKYQDQKGRGHISIGAWQKQIAYTYLLTEDTLLE
jgi:hypothetical protein